MWRGAGLTALLTLALVAALGQGAGGAAPADPPSASAARSAGAAAGRYRARGPRVRLQLRTGASGRRVLGARLGVRLRCGAGRGRSVTRNFGRARVRRSRFTLRRRGLRVSGRFSYRNGFRVTGRVRAGGRCRANLRFSGRLLGRRFYVSPGGSDSASGLSSRKAWRTIRRVNRSRLGPGDIVLFRGGARFSDARLTPPVSGATRAPLAFGSFGPGRANLARGVFLSSKRHLTFTGLDLKGASQGVLGSGQGAGSSNILVQDSSFSGVGIAVNAANASDRNWSLRGNRIQGTRDSGVILLGGGHQVTGNTILSTGRSGAIPHGKHGIYLKSFSSRVTRNTIRDFDDAGVSSRFRNAVIEGNAISGGELGIAWHQNDSRAGRSYWRNNRISATTAACLYVSRSDSAGRTRESFVITGNRLSRRSGKFVDFQPTFGSYSVLGNAEG